MPIIFLSPSVQEYNPYVDGGNEEYYMNLIADAMIPYLLASGIEYVRNDPNQSVSVAIAQSNAGNFDFHLALHSNAAPPANAGQVRGTDVYYYPGSVQSERAATIFANNLKEIYPNPSLVRTLPTTSLAEVSRTTAPTILIELAYHDNPEDAQWIRDNIDRIAENLAISTADFLNVSAQEPTPARQGKVVTQSTNLNIRSEPNTNAAIVGKAPKGATVTILGEDNGWYLITYNGITGYASAQFISV